MATRDEILMKCVKVLEEVVERLDRLENQKQQDPWDQDFDLAGTSTPEAGRAIQVLAEQDSITLPPEWLDMNEEQRTAWLRVKADGGVPGPIEPEARTVTIELANGLGTEFPAPSEAALAAWSDNAWEVCENFRPDPKKGTSITAELAAEAYKKGGPLWLSAYDHEFIMGLPYGWRQRMVREVTEYAPKDGSELGRDILRDETEAQNEHALQELREREPRAGKMVRG